MDDWHRIGKIGKGGYYASLNRIARPDRRRLLIVGCKAKKASVPANPSIVKAPTDADFATNPAIPKAQGESIGFGLTYAEITRNLGSEGIQLPGKYSVAYWNNTAEPYSATCKDDTVLFCSNDTTYPKHGDTMAQAIAKLGKPSSIEERTLVLWGGKNQTYILVIFRNGTTSYIESIPDKSTLDAYKKLYRF